MIIKIERFIEFENFEVKVELENNEIQLLAAAPPIIGSSYYLALLDDVCGCFELDNFFPKLELHGANTRLYALKIVPIKKKSLFDLISTSICLLDSKFKVITSAKIPYHFCMFSLL
jgi:hypothetical protein